MVSVSFNTLIVGPAKEVSRQSGIPLGDAPLPGLHEQQPVTIECYSLAGLNLME